MKCIKPILNTSVLAFLLVVGGLSAALGPARAQTWTQTSAPSTNWSCVASSADGSKLVAAVNGGLVYTSSDSGATWVATGAPGYAWTCVASSADGNKLAAGGWGTGGSIYTSTNSGATWAGGPVVWCNSLASSADGSKLAAAAGFALFVSSDSGATWTWLGPSTFPVSFSITLVASSADGNTLVVVEDWDQGPPSQVYPTPSSVWAPQNADPPYFWGLCTAVAVSADGTRIGATVNSNSMILSPAPCNGMLYNSSNSSASWTMTCTTVGDWTSVVSSADGTRLAAVASSGAIYTSTGSGVSCASTNVTDASWSSVASSADGAKLVAVANGGGIYTWQSIPTPTLNITPAGNGLVISWIIPSMSFVLQQNSGLNPTHWTDVATLPVLNLTNLQNQVTVSLPSQPTFYRLKGLGL